MAFSALSMSYKSGKPGLDALQHYQQALPSLQASLRTEQDLTSDGVFLTHFILLLYEVCTCFTFRSSFNCLIQYRLLPANPEASRSGPNTLTNFYVSVSFAVKITAQSPIPSLSGGLLP